MHKLNRIPTRSRHDPFGYAIMICDPKNGGMGTDYDELVDCRECLRLIRLSKRPAIGRGGFE